MTPTPKLTLEELAARVDELEAQNTRLRALGDPGAAGTLLTEAAEQPTRDAYEVRSELTGAVVGRHDEQADAAGECDRLNDECRRDGVKHRGERMSYEVVKVRVTDEQAVYEQRVATLKTHIDDADDEDELAEFVAELERVEAEHG